MQMVSAQTAEPTSTYGKNKLEFLETFLHRRRSYRTSFDAKEDIQVDCLDLLGFRVRAKCLREKGCNEVLDDKNSLSA